MLPAYFADAFLLFRSKSQLLIAVAVIGRMTEYGFQIEVDGTCYAGWHVIVKMLEPPGHTHFLAAAEVRALLLRLGIAERIEYGNAGNAGRIGLRHVISETVFFLAALIVEA